MYPAHDEDPQMELVPEPLFAGGVSEFRTSQECLDNTMGDIDTYMDSFQHDISELQIMEEAKHPSKDIRSIAEEETASPPSRSHDLQKPINNKLAIVKRSTPESTVPNPLVVRKTCVKRAEQDKSSTVPSPSTNTVQSQNPAVAQSRPQNQISRAQAPRWSVAGLSRIDLPPRRRMDVGSSGASTVVDYQIHQQLAQYEFSSDPVSPKTPPISPKTQYFK